VFRAHVISGIIAANKAAISIVAQLKNVSEAAYGKIILSWRRIAPQVCTTLGR
jgi:hypothetical protein